MNQPQTQKSTTSTGRIIEQKCAQACAGCRGRKIRCNGGLPCPNCEDRSLECYYPQPQSRGPRSSKNASAGNQGNALSSDRPPPTKVARTETGASMSKRTHDCAETISTTSTFVASLHDGHPSNASGAAAGTFNVVEPRSLTPNRANIPLDAKLIVDSAVFTTDFETTKDTAKLLDCDASAAPDGNDSLLEGEVTCEYHGPGAMISICSKSAVAWVCGKTGDTDFARMAARFSSDISRRLKLERGIFREEAPEPSESVAWSYCSAFFSDASGLLFKVLHQASFEARLAAHFKDGNLRGRDDPSWYALRNIVYATGCRSLRSKQLSSDFHATHRQSWQYFCNALSVYTDLLFYRTGLSSVQALALMSAFVESVACPSLEFMICSDALRLAESKGLHRGSSSTRLQNEADIQAASHTWWAIYTHHAIIVARSGRSLQIDETTITCPLPTQGQGLSWGQHATIVAMIKHAHIVPLVIRSQNTVRASKSLSDQTFAVVHGLDKTLQEWKNALPSFAQPESVPGGNDLPKGVSPDHCLYVKYSYYATLIQIHSLLMLPWGKVYQEAPTENPIHQAQIAKSASIVAEASRKIIRLLRYITITPATLKWAVMVYPMLALIHIFIYILEYPTLGSVDTDVSLMHEAAAHFNFLEYRTGSWSLPFVRDLANLVRVAVARQREHLSLISANNNNPEIDVHDLDGFNGVPNSDRFDMGDLESANWDAFIPWDDMLEDFCSGDK